MDHIILERTANGLSENCHNIGEARYAIHGDAFLLENDPVVYLVPRGWFIALDKWDPFKQRIVVWGNAQSTHERVCCIVEKIKLSPNVSMTYRGKEMLLDQ